MLVVALLVSVPIVDILACNVLGMGVALGSVIGSGRNGSSMLESTSWSRRPSISISCIFARATNLHKHM